MLGRATPFPEDSSTKALCELKQRLDDAVSIDIADTKALEELIVEIYELLESDSHLTWSSIEQSGLNKGIGQLQKREKLNNGNLQKLTTRVVKKLVEVSDTARGGGCCLSVTEPSCDQSLEAVRKTRKESITVTPDDVWHALPDRQSCWQLGGEAPVRLDMVEGNTRHSSEIRAATSHERVKGRVSVVVATMSDRYRFHGQIWLCYFSQTYQDKELIVVESGERQSPFFSNLDAEKIRGVKYVHFGQDLSIGEKRNIAIREYSTGEIIANFDDDDLYFPAYLSTMVKLLTSSKVAMAHLGAWHVIDVETEFCATFNRDIHRPSREEALALSGFCGFSMVYTYAAWQCLPWPAWTCGEDAAYLKAFLDVGMPVTSRNDDGKAMTVLHVQHGSNFRRSVCHAPRTDAKAVAAMIARFESACRRLMKINLCEYEEGGEALLYTYGISFHDEPPFPRGLFLFQAETDSDMMEAYSSWCSSEEGMHPHRNEMLQQQRCQHHEKPENVVSSET